MGEDLSEGFFTRIKKGLERRKTRKFQEEIERDLSLKRTRYEEETNKILNHIVNAEITMEDKERLEKVSAKAGKNGRFPRFTLTGEDLYEVISVANQLLPEAARTEDRVLRFQFFTSVNNMTVHSGKDSPLKPLREIKYGEHHFGVSVIEINGNDDNGGYLFSIDPVTFGEHTNNTISLQTREYYILIAQAVSDKLADAGLPIANRLDYKENN